MELITDFVKYLKGEVKNNSLYLWGGQGESVMKTNPATVAKMETTPYNAGRVLTTLAGKLKAGVDMSNAKYFDCSGLGCYYFISHGLIKADTTAHGLYKMCDEIEPEQLRAGDFVFKLDTAGRATHIGYCINKNREIVECFGRDRGVIRAEYNNGTKWNKAGRPRFNWK